MSSLLKNQGALAAQAHSFSGKPFAATRTTTGLTVNQLVSAALNDIATATTATGGTTAPSTVTTPSVPTSTTVVTNTTGYDVTAYITGGTVSVVKIGTVATGLTLATGVTGTVDLPANQSISMTYSVAPTWAWFPNSASAGPPAGYLWIIVGGVLQKLAYYNV